MSVQAPPITGAEQAQPHVAPEQIIQKDGYIYIYVSNESAQKVYFDNLVIHHNRGPILQTDSYYPFGLTMAGISDQAALSLENNYKFNGIELNHKEFSDGSGLELYTAKFRGLDPQIGRWWQIDPKPTYDASLYAAMQDNPIQYIDILGDTVIVKNGIASGDNVTVHLEPVIDRGKLPKGVQAIILHRTDGGSAAGAINAWIEEKGRAGAQYPHG